MVRNEDQSKDKDVLGGLEDEFIGLVEFLNNQEDPTSENYATALKATMAVGNLWGDLNKIKLEEIKANLEYRDRKEQREHEWKIKEAELKAKKEADDTAYQIKQLEIVDMSKMRGKDWAQICVDTGKTVLPLLTLVGITVLGWSNENHPIKPLITTSGTTRQATGILSRFIK